MHTGDALIHKIRQSKVVFVEAYYDQSVLTVHRINQVLRQGVPVIAPHSADLELDAEYERFGVIFTDDPVPLEFSEQRAGGHIALEAKLHASHVIDVVHPRNRARLVADPRATGNYAGKGHVERVRAAVCEAVRQLCKD